MPGALLTEGSLHAKHKAGTVLIDGDPGTHQWTLGGLGPMAVQASNILLM